MTLTKEWLQKTIAELEEERDAVPGAVNEDAAMALAAMKRALASLEAKPIGAFHISDQQVGGTTDYIKDGEWPIDDGVIEVYAAPPAPVTLPDLKELEAILDWILMLPCPTPKATHFAKRLAVVIDTCRGAMLQGAEQPQSAQQNIPEIIPGGLVEAVNNLLNNDGSRGRYSAIGCGEAREKIELWLAQRQKWGSQRSENLCAGNSPVIPDGWIPLPIKLTAENGAKGALLGEFSETKFINCPECFGDDECETCDGSGRLEITVPVSWTTIKAIWAKGVEHFSAAPQQEV